MESVLSYIYLKRDLYQTHKYDTKKKTLIKTKIFTMQLIYHTINQKYGQYLRKDCFQFVFELTTLKLYFSQRLPVPPTPGGVAIGPGSGGGRARAATAAGPDSGAAVWPEQRRLVRATAAARDCIPQNDNMLYILNTSDSQ